MKRAAVFGMVIVVIASAWTYLAAQSAPISAPQKSMAPLPGAPPQTFDDGRPQTAAVLSPLQQRFIDLATKKARLMNEEQLQQSVNELDRDVEELHAWTRVEESAKILREVIEKHPQSRAAATARSAIRIIDNGRPSNSADGSNPSPPTPIPDQRFDRKIERRAPAEPPPSDTGVPFGTPSKEPIPSRGPNV